MQMQGSYLDSLSEVAHGEFRYFHPNRRLATAGKYVKGKKQGLWLDYYADGMMKDSTVYVDGIKTGTCLSWHSNGYVSDSAVYATDGSGVVVSWFDNGSPSKAGRYNAGFKKTGKWVFYHKNGKPSAIEVYENDQLVTKENFDESGTIVVGVGDRDEPATFKGGMNAWKQFLEKQIYFPSQYKIVNADEAVVVVQGVVDEEGNVTDVQVINPFASDFDKIAVNALRKSPKWTPAVSHNRHVKYQIQQYVTFVQATR
jgi:hypothetical protein